MPLCIISWCVLLNVVSTCLGGNTDLIGCYINLKKKENPQSVPLQRSLLVSNGLFCFHEPRFCSRVQNFEQRCLIAETCVKRFTEPCGRWIITGLLAILSVQKQKFKAELMVKIFRQFFLFYKSQVFFQSGCNKEHEKTLLDMKLRCTHR